MFLSQSQQLPMLVITSFSSTSAHPRKRIQLAFDDIYYIEPSFECRFDNIEIRDGPFVFSPLINRFCGAKSPGIVTSSGRFMWIRFISDEELEGMGFRVEYSYAAGKCILQFFMQLDLRIISSNAFLLCSFCIHFVALDFFIQKPHLHPDPDFHLHVGGLLNPIPGKRITLIYGAWVGRWLFQGVCPIY